MKKVKKSPVVIALYVIAAIGLVYTFYLVGSTVSYLLSYYSSYGMKVEFVEVAKYVVQSTFSPFLTVTIVFAAACILDEVRALNPAYCVTEKEVSVEEEQAEEKTEEEQVEEKTEEEKLEEEKLEEEKTE